MAAIIDTSGSDNRFITSQAGVFKPLVAADSVTLSSGWRFAAVLDLGSGMTLDAGNSITGDGALTFGVAAGAFDLILKMGDNAGTQAVSFTDSLNSEVARLDSDGGFQIDGEINIDGAGTSNVAGNLTVAGDLDVQGTTTSFDSENVLVADRFILYNAQYQTNTAVTAGDVFVTTAVDAATLTISLSSLAGLALAGSVVAGDSGFTTSADPTVALAIGDLITVVGNSDNNGIYEVKGVSTAPNQVAIKLSADASVSGVVNTSIVTNAVAGGTLVNVDVSIMRADAAGSTFSVGFGSSTPITYDALVSTAGASPWTTDTNVVNLVTDGNSVTIGSATAGGKLFIDGDAIAEVTLQVQAAAGQTADVLSVESSASAAYFQILGHATLPGAAIFSSPDNTGAAFQVAQSTEDYILVTTTNAAEGITFGNGTTNPLYSFLGSGQTTFAGNVDANSGLDVTTAALTASAGFTLSGGQGVVTGGTGFKVNDNIPLEVGTGGDLSMTHDGANSLIWAKVGDLVIDNTVVTGSVIFRQGTDTAATDFKVVNNSNADLFVVFGSGDVTIPTDSSLAIGAGGDYTIDHNGTNTVITSATGNLITDNTSVVGATIFQLGSDSTATSFQILNNTGDKLLGVDGAGGLRMLEQSTPVLLANTGITYTKDAGGTTELFYLDSNGIETQLTGDGATGIESYTAFDNITAGSSISLYDDAGTLKAGLSEADGVNLRKRAVGIALNAATAGTTVYVATQGAEVIVNSNLSAASLGDLVYLDGTAGLLTTTAPFAAGFDQFKMGLVSTVGIAGVATIKVQMQFIASF